MIELPLLTPTLALTKPITIFDTLIEQYSMATHKHRHAPCWITRNWKALLLKGCPMK
jgi:hypothetical protein